MEATKQWQHSGEWVSFGHEDDCECYRGGGSCWGWSCCDSIQHNEFCNEPHKREAREMYEALQRAQENSRYTEDATYKDIDTFSISEIKAIVDDEDEERYKRETAALVLRDRLTELGVSILFDIIYYIDYECI